MFTEGEEMYLQGKDVSITEQENQTLWFFSHRPQEFINHPHVICPRSTVVVLSSIVSSYFFSWYPFALLGGHNCDFAGTLHPRWGSLCLLKKWNLLGCLWFWHLMDSLARMVYEIPDKVKGFPLISADHFVGNSVKTKGKSSRSCSEFVLNHVDLTSGIHWQSLSSSS